MKGTALTRFSGRYLEALRIHLDRSPKESLQSAHELGSQALAFGLETLGLAKIHDLALAELIPAGCVDGHRDDMNARAGVFFIEANLPIETTHRVALEAGASLKRLNAELAQHARDLAGSDRALERHTARRKTTEAALKTSERASSRLLKESRQLEGRLRDVTRKILSANEEERRKMSLQLQDEIAQTLLGIHVRLLALKTEAAANHAGLTEEIATTQRLVEASMKTIDRFTREFGIPHEN
jgi:signal transduction histidine kinase